MVVFCSSEFLVTLIIFRFPKDKVKSVQVWNMPDGNPAKYIRVKFMVSAGRCNRSRSSRLLTQFPFVPRSRTCIHIHNNFVWMRSRLREPHPREELDQTDDGIHSYGCKCLTTLLPHGVANRSHKHANLHMYLKCAPNFIDRPVWILWILPARCLLGNPQRIGI